LNKNSISTRIYVLARKYGKYIFLAPILGIAAWYSVKFIVACFTGKMGYFGGALAVAVMTIWGIIISLFISPRIGTWVGNFFFTPKVHLKVVPEILSPIRGMITKGEYAEAIEELNSLLERKPFSPEPYLMLVELYEKELNDYQRAMELIERYFGRKKVYTFDENVDMLLLYADICAEHNYLHKAYVFLEREAKRKGYHELKRKRLQARLEAINELMA
jgi:tetratricopeptide (TPR) repeat protein